MNYLHLTVPSEASVKNDLSRCGGYGSKRVVFRA